MYTYFLTLGKSFVTHLSAMVSQRALKCLVGPDLTPPRIALAIGDIS